MLILWMLVAILLASLFLCYHVVVYVFILYFEGHNEFMTEYGSVSSWDVVFFVLPVITKLRQCGFSLGFSVLRRFNASSQKNAQCFISVSELCLSGFISVSPPKLLQLLFHKLHISFQGIGPFRLVETFCAGRCRA